MIEIFETCQTKSIAKQTNMDESLIIRSIPFPESCFCFDYVLYFLSYVWSRDLVVRQWPAVHDQVKQRFLNENFKTRWNTHLMLQGRPYFLSDCAAMAYIWTNKKSRIMGHTVGAYQHFVPRLFWRVCVGTTWIETDVDRLYPVVTKAYRGGGATAPPPL